MAKYKKSEQELLEGYIEFLKKRLNSENYQKRVSKEEYAKEKDKYDKAKLKMKLLYKWR